MGRRKVPVRPEPGPDLKYGSSAVSKFARRMMYDGKKSVSFRCLYGALGFVKKKTGKEELEIFTRALDNVKPVLEVKSHRVGGSTQQVPVEVRETRREALGMRWIITAARGRSGRSMAEKLGAEIVDASNSTGMAFKKKEDIRRMAEANRAFMHYRW